MTENDQPVVIVKDLKKTFKLPHENHSGFKQIVTNAFKKNKKRGYEIQEVLKGVSFEVNRGDFFGIVGRNGSGKSTLLKLLAGIYSPDSGSVAINGSVVPFIELGVGFNPELTGRENVYMNGALLGFSHQEMDGMYDDIVAFAELERFMDQKLKNYSSGMQVRLAFSIAIKAQGDILILDEVLAVGDEAFQRKCNDYFDEIKKDKNKTVILVTHSMDSVKKYCNKALMIRRGKIVALGSTDDVANQYSLDNLVDSTAINSQNRINENKTLEEFSISLVNKKIVTQDDDIAVQFTIKSLDDVRLRIEMDVQDINRNTYIFSSGTDLRLCKKGRVYKETVRFPTRDLNDADLRINSSLKDDKGAMIAFVWNEDAPTFMLRRNDYPGGKSTRFATLFNRGAWSHEE